MGKTSYVIALGSNRRHRRYGAPDKILAAACGALAEHGVELLDVAPTFRTAAVGPAGRSFANGAAHVASALDPVAMLHLLKRIETDFGRRRGRRWGPRVLDLDIILWSQGSWTSRGLTIPHPGFRMRRFVLDPLISIAADWRDPLSGQTIRQLRTRLASRKPVDHRRGAA